MPIITSHSELAKAIAGKRILHLNSLGKDAALTLDWLNNYAKVDVVSVHFELKIVYPTDNQYWEMQKRRYPRTQFARGISMVQFNEILSGEFQSPLFINHVINKQEFGEFDAGKYLEELMVKYHCDYLCSGISCYEGMGRAIYLRRVGLMNEDRKEIYPIGLMKQAQIMQLLTANKIPLNPSYKIAPESHDSASYFKLRNAFAARPDFKRSVYKHFPMLALDEYRYEVLFGKNKKA